MKVNSNLCPACGAQLTGIKSNFRAKTQIGSVAFCRSCNLPYKRFATGANLDAGWFSTNVEEKHITLPIEMDKVHLMEKEITRYEQALKKWSTFLAFIGEGDQLFFLKTRRIKHRVYWR